MAANAAGHAKYLIAWTKARDAGPDAVNRAGKVDAENRR
jgi:hypothetical protein